MTAVIQSPPHEIARQEKLAHLAAVDAREELQRRHSQGQADAGAEAERQARLAPRVELSNFRRLTIPTQVWPRSAKLHKPHRSSRPSAPASLRRRRRRSR